MKEMLRLHPAVPALHRSAGKDIVVPLSKPLTTLSGKAIQEVLIPKGTRLILSIAAYNRYDAFISCPIRALITKPTNVSP